MQSSHWRAGPSKASVSGGLGRPPASQCKQLQAVDRRAQVMQSQWIRRAGPPAPANASRMQSHKSVTQWRRAGRGGPNAKSLESRPARAGLVVDIVEGPPVEGRPAAS